MKKHSRELIYLAGFLFTIPIALTAYINSSFLEIYFDEYYISIIYAIASIITILGLVEMPRLLTRFGNRATILCLSLVLLISFFLLSISSSTIMIVVSFIFYFCSSIFIFFSLDIFLEDFSKNLRIGRIRGIYLTIISSAWIVSQLISGSIITQSSFRGIYLISILFIILFSLIFIFFLRDFVDPKYKKIMVSKTIKLFVHNKNISKIYFINLILQFFYAWMIIYTPIYLYQEIGFNWNQIGIIFSIMLLPFLILEFPLGKLSDSIGEKKMLIVGFSIIALFTAVMPLVHVPKLWLWTGILFLTRVGAATIEVMSEVYFFKSVNEENSETISFFRNTGPLSFIVSSIFAVIFFYFVSSFQYLFFVLSAIMLGGLLVSLRLRDVK